MAYSGAIDGIISGLDTTKIIDAIITYERKRVDLYTARKTENTNRISTWKSIQAMLLAVKTQAALLSDDRLWLARKVWSSDDNSITAQATTSAAVGVYFLTVTRLATNHQIASQGFNFTDQNIGNGTIEIQVGDKAVTTITVDSSNNTLAKIKDAINRANCDVTAAIVSDGSSSNPYRLVLTAKSSGAANQIKVRTSLSGGSGLNFDQPAFDSPEKLFWSGGATSVPTLGSTAVYSGSTNKTYTFTIAGSGLQTVGGGTIAINWTDGTHSGTIGVTAADTDVALTGDGADSLVLRFSAGTLQAGDTFQVQTFAPTIQPGQDAVLQMGSSQSGGSPIVITSASNVVRDVIEGVTLNLKAVTSGSAVKITVEEDRDKIKAQIREFVSKYNEYQSFVDGQMAYKPETKEAGLLLGDGTLLTYHNDIRSLIMHVYSGRPEHMRRLSQAGIRFGSDGKLKFDESVFDKKVNEAFADLVNLFKTSGVSDNSYVEYVSSSAKTKISAGIFRVDITQAATRGSYTGTAITNPASTNLVIEEPNTKLRVKLNNSISAMVTLAPKTYASGEELASDLENAINANPSLAAIGVDVEWHDNGETGYLTITSRQYGSISAVAIENDPEGQAASLLGLLNGTAVAGTDVAGTINGESATGTGQYLVGNAGNATSADLKLKVTLTPEMILSGAEANITFNKGAAALISERLDRYADTYEGVIKGKTDALEKQNESLAKQITALEQQLERRRAALYKQFTAMEEALAKLQAQQEYLTNAIVGLNQLRQIITTGKTK